MPRPESLDWSWAQRTGGRLSAAQKRELLRALIPTVLRYPAFRLRVATGRRGSARLDLDALTWPDSTLAREAEAHAREMLAPWVLEHSYRTWIFGLLLAQLDGTVVDDELAFVVAILHDLALEHPTPGRCFAVVGGEQARAWALGRGTPPDRAEAIGAAIGGHITPGASDDLTDPAGLVSAGAFTDITGFGLEHMDPAWVTELHRRHPRQDLRQHLIPAWKAEGRSVPDGRANTLTRYSGFTALLRLAPFKD